MSGIPPPPFALTDIDRAQPLWARLNEYLNDELASARRRNDKPDLDDRATAALRGEIRCLKKIIALGSAPLLTEIDVDAL